MTSESLRKIFTAATAIGALCVVALHPPKARSTPVDTNYYQVVGLVEGSDTASIYEVAVEGIQDNCEVELNRDLDALAGHPKITDYVLLDDKGGGKFVSRQDFLDAQVQNCVLVMLTGDATQQHFPQLRFENSDTLLGPVLHQ